MPSLLAMRGLDARRFKSSRAVFRYRDFAAGLTFLPLNHRTALLIHLIHLPGDYVYAAIAKIQAGQTGSEYHGDGFFLHWAMDWPFLSKRNPQLSSEFLR